MSALQELLKDTFGYDDFRPGQETIIRHVLRQENVLGIMPTGGGKSICYQLPALLLDNLTLVISPLISLMNRCAYFDTWHRFHHYLMKDSGCL